MDDDLGSDDDDDGDGDGDDDAVAVASLVGSNAEATRSSIARTGNFSTAVRLIVGVSTLT
jgi:hypothetical protein